MWRRVVRKQETPVWIFCDGSTGALFRETWQAPGSRQRKRTSPNDVSDHKRLRKTTSCTAAAVARDAEGEIIEWAWQTLSPLTNNEAEYAALVLGLQMAYRHRWRKVICVLDSEVVVGQMEGRFRINSAKLRDWNRQARAAERKLEYVRYCLVPREWNRLADGLAAHASMPWPLMQDLMKKRMTGKVEIG